MISVERTPSGRADDRASVVLHRGNTLLNYARVHQLPKFLSGNSSY
jgi:hypothetical protein